MKTYTPKQAMKKVKRQQNVTSALCTVGGVGAFVSMVAAIGLAEGTGTWVQLALAVLGTVACAFGAWLADLGRYYWERQEEEIIREYSDCL